LSTGKRACLPSHLVLVFDGKAWNGHGDGNALCESTRQDLRFHRRDQKDFRKGRRKAYGPASSPGMTTASWFRKSWRCPRAPVGTSKDSIPLGFVKSEAWQGKREIIFLDPMGIFCYQKEKDQTIWKIPPSTHRRNGGRFSNLWKSPFSMLPTTASPI